MVYGSFVLLASQNTNRPTVSGILLIALPTLMFLAIAVRMWITWRNKRK